MDNFDPVVLARIQFAANMTFHILFPTISISMGWVLLFFKTRFAATGQAHWMDAYQFWVKIFALTFALGVVSGITMSFQWHQLAGFHEHGGQRGRAAVGLRGAHCLLPGGHDAWHHAVWAGPRE